MERVINLELMMESVYRDLIGLQSATVPQWRRSPHTQNLYYFYWTEFTSKCSARKAVPQIFMLFVNNFDMTVILKTLDYNVVHKSGLFLRM